MKTSSNKPLSARGQQIVKLLQERIVFLDGAMGTMIQQHKLQEEDFRGEKFKDVEKPLKGNNDLLVFTRPDVIAGIHKSFMEAGSDIIESNTFSGTSIAQADYGLENIVYELNKTAVELARKSIDEFEATHPGRTCFVAGSIGPTNRTCSLSPDVERPEYRNVTFDQLVESYTEQLRGLVDGGADVLLVETIFDTLNAKAALFAIEQFFDTREERLPVMISVTITDQSGRTLSGQTVEAFWHSIRHAHPLSVGINCALGADLMRPYMEDLSRIADCYTSCYPNAGLPNPLAPTGYDETPESISAALGEYAQSGFINIVGGCCGTTPAHVGAVVKEASKYPPRQVPEFPPRLRLSGLEGLTIG
ncbi:MAG: homocysteine S-methyltransferase family protein [Puniceicoccales bacterium]